MGVNNDTVDKIAKLAKLEFDENSKEAIKDDMNKMLNFVGKLSELDTENIDPLIYMLDEEPVLRTDKVTGHVSQDEALKNAPQKDSDYFKVPKVIKKN